MNDFSKTPRIFADQPLSEGMSIVLPENASHYLKNVMRAGEGDFVRLFNGRDGEFVGKITTATKRAVTITATERLLKQPAPPRRVHLMFTPLKKERLDFLIEKAVELGATDLHPVLTQNTDIRKINEDRIKAQIVEAAEQCERLDIPSLHAPADLFVKLAGWNADTPLYAALERTDAPLLRPDLQGDCGILIGPPGGFTADERNKITALPYVRPAALGPNILRSETAAIAALSLMIRGS